MVETWVFCCGLRFDLPFLFPSYSPCLSIDVLIVAFNLLFLFGPRSPSLRRLIPMRRCGEKAMSFYLVMVFFVFSGIDDDISDENRMTEPAVVSSASVRDSASDGTSCLHLPFMCLHVSQMFLTLTLRSRAGPSRWGAPGSHRPTCIVTCDRIKNTHTMVAHGWEIVFSNYFT